MRFICPACKHEFAESQFQSGKGRERWFCPNGCKDTFVRLLPADSHEGDQRQPVTQEASQAVETRPGSVQVGESPPNPNVAQKQPANWVEQVQQASNLTPAQFDVLGCLAVLGGLFMFCCGCPAMIGRSPRPSAPRGGAFEENANRAVREMYDQGYSQEELKRAVRSAPKQYWDDF